MTSFDPSAADVTVNLAPTGEIWLAIGDVASRPLADHEMIELVYSIEQFRELRPK